MNVKRKRVKGGGSSYSKTTNHMGQATNYSLMNEVYGERAFSIAAPKAWNTLPLNVRSNQQHPNLRT